MTVAAESFGCVVTATTISFPCPGDPMVSAPASRFVRSSSALLLALGISAGAATSTAAQTATFGGAFNGATPTVAFSGQALTFSTQVRTGFGNTAAVGTADGLWWTSQYSGQGMLYGNNSTLGNVLEVTLNAGAGFSLNLNGALFGGWPNTARNVTYRLFNADYSLSTGPLTVLAAAATPASPLFPVNGWGSIIHLQFTETTALGASAGRGAFDVGVQNIGYTVTPANGSVVPEPSTYILLATGMGMLGVITRRRRSSVGSEA